MQEARNLVGKERASACSVLLTWLIACCVQALFNKIVTATGTPTVINEDNSVNIDVFKKEIMTRDKINGYPMALFPYMWQVNAWRHPVIGEVSVAAELRARTCGHFGV
jgi:hypothetical protein